MKPPPSTPAIAAGSAADLKRHHNPVAHLKTANIVANSDDLGQAFMTDRVSGRYWQPALADTDVQVATGHRQRPNQRLFGRGDFRFGHLAPRVSAGLFECQLPHL